MQDKDSSPKCLTTSATGFVQNLATSATSGGCVQHQLLRDVRDLAVEARRRLDRHEDGPYFSFCMGFAEVAEGDPLAMYPQAEINARAVRRHYELLRIEEPGEGADSP